MTILIILALLALVVVYVVCFLLCKVGWLIFKSHSNKGPLITAGVCTVLFAALVGSAMWIGTRAVLAPFQGIKTRVQQNPAPIYGQHTYRDTTFPFELTVYDGMDFADWIRWGNVQFKLGIDTNAFKKDASGKTADNFLMAALVRQANVTDENPLDTLPAQIQNDRRISIAQQQRTLVNGYPAYQAQGEAYSNNGKIYFWHTSLQTDPHTVYHLAVISLQNTPQLQQKALDMQNSFRLNAP